MARKRKKNSGIRGRHLVMGVLLTAALALLLTPGPQPVRRPADWTMLRRASAGCM